MFIPLVDLLRCPRPHEETWLVASIDQAIDRDIVTGTLGCPVCLAEYPIRDGIVLFDDVAVATRLPANGVREDDAVRLAAALDLTDARMTALLHGAWGAYAPVLRGLTPAQLLLVNPPNVIASGDGVSIIRVSGELPLARGSIAGVAVDDDAADAMLASFVSSLRAGGRMLGRNRRPIPPGVAELARDEEVWVAQREASAAESAPVTLSRRTR